jgi:hypothetical protein
MSESIDFAAHYKRSVASRYRGIKPDELSEIPSGALWLSPKIDGELWLAVLDGGIASLVAANGRSLAAPLLLAELTVAAGRVKGRTVIAGELFAAGGKPRPRVGDVAAAIAEGAAGVERLGWQAFDLLEADGERAPLDYGERHRVIEKLLAGGKRVVAIKTVATDDREELKSRWQEWGQSGKAEGMVVRCSDGRIFKVKPEFTVDAAVVGFTTRAGEPDQARSLLLSLVRDDGAHQLLCGVGSLGSDAARRALLAKLEPLQCAGSFRHTSGDGALYQWVRPELVVEVTCTDVQIDDSEGEAQLRWTLRHTEAGWEPLAAMPGGSLLHPVLVRVRDDKRPTVTDVRASQLTERAPVADLDCKAERVELPRSELRRREVWTKESKGKTSVRKLVVWETHKSEAVPGWPAWVVHFTDYSPDRKSPLDRTLKTAQTREEANTVAAALIEENIKKGWEPVTAGRSAPAAEPPAAAPKPKRAKKTEQPS